MPVQWSNIISNSNGKQESAHKRFRILTVDDESINLELISSALKDEYDMYTAMDGHDAISQLRGLMPDLILLDVMMPDINGFELCNIIKSNGLYADIPIIFLTALDTHEGARNGLDAGGIDYLTKPVDLELLKLRVRNHLESKERKDLLKEQRDLLAGKNEELESSLARIKRLEGIIPIWGIYLTGVETTYSVKYAKLMS